MNEDAFGRVRLVRRVLGTKILGGTNYETGTPMRRLIKTFPEVAKEVFDKCYTLKSDPETCYEYDFRYLDDTWMLISEDGKELIHEEDPYQTYDNLSANTRPYSKSTKLIYDNHPLRLLLCSECECLLTHQLVRGLLNHKWNAFGKYFYLVSLIMYSIFLFFFSAYVMSTSAPYNAVEGKNEDGACNRIEHRPSVRFLVYGWGVLILVYVHLLKEIWLFRMGGRSYVSVGNLLEILIFISAFLVVLDLDDCAKRTGIRQGWQWNLAAGSAFLQWINLLMIIRKLSRFGIYVLMFVDIFMKSFCFILILALFIFTFSITFCIIFQNRPEFSTMSSSMLKTTVMMIGEFEYTGIFHGDADHHQERTYMNDIARPIFLFFVIVMSILLMNILTSLAVEDIKSIMEKANTKRLRMQVAFKFVVFWLGWQVDLVLDIERATPRWVLKRIAKGGEVLFPNRSGWWKRLLDRLFIDETQEIVKENTDPAVVEGERRIAQQPTALDTRQSNVDRLHKKQLQMEEKQLQMAEKQQQMADILDKILKAVQKEESEPPGTRSPHSSRA